MPRRVVYPLMASNRPPQSYFLFEETVGDEVVFRYPSRYARFAGVERIFLYLVGISAIFAFARFYARTTPADMFDRWALYGAAFVLSIPAIECIRALLMLLWTRRAVVLHPGRRTISDLTRTPFRERIRHYPLESVKAVLILREDNHWTVTIELLDDTLLYLGCAQEKENVRALARRAAAHLGVAVREPAGTAEPTSSAR